MFSYLHPDFNQSFTRHLSLLIEIDFFQFSFCIYNQNTGEISAIKKVQYNPQQKFLFEFDKFQEAINSEDILHCPFAEQHAAIAWSQFTCVPNALFDSSISVKYLELVSQPDTDASTHFENVESLDISVVFAIHHKLKYFFEKVQPKVMWHSAAVPFLGNALKVTSPQSEHVFLDVKNGYYYLSLFHNNNLIFINRFNFSNVEDFMYYVLLICEQKKFDRNTLQLFISGEITDDSQLYRELYKFFMHLQFQNITEFYQLPEINSIPMHSLHTLFGLHLCASFQEI